LWYKKSHIQDVAVLFDFTMVKSKVKHDIYQFISQHEPFVKVTEDFKDNPDLGCKDAFESIKTYRNDPDAYKEQFE